MRTQVQARERWHTHWRAVMAMFRFGLRRGKKQMNPNLKQKDNCSVLPDHADMARPLPDAPASFFLPRALQAQHRR